MALFLLIVFFIIFYLIVKLSNVQSENIELLSEKCRNEMYELYKRKSTKYLFEEFQNVSKEYNEKLNHYIELYKEQHGSECYTPFGYNEEKLLNGGKSFMRYDKNDMRLYHQYNVISEILERRNNK